MTAVVPETMEEILDLIRRDHWTDLRLDKKAVSLSSTNTTASLSQFVCDW